MIFLTTPTTTAAETAVRNANRDAIRYNLRPATPTRSYWWAEAKDGHSAYLVATPSKADPNGHCDCPFFAVNGCCKHAEMVAEEARTWDEADAASADL